METIEIHASHTAVRQYELATLNDRGLAYLIDLVLALSFCSGIYLYLRMYYSTEQDIYYVSAYCLPFFILYSLLFETFNKGKSLGKYMMKIRVIKADGSTGKFYDYLVRWVFRILDLYLSLGVFAIILFSLTEHNQRLGDLIANTVVVKE